MHEPWWTATARHADIVLPATTSLERNDIGGSPLDRFVIAMQHAIEPVGEARNDFDIFRDLARRLGCEDAFAEGRDETAWLRHLYETFRERAQSNLVPEFDTFWEKGWFEIPPCADEYVLFDEFRADPDNNKLRTPSGRIELYSDEIAGFGYDNCPPHPAWIEPAEWLGGDAAQCPLHLVSSQPRQKLHSQMDAGPVSARGKTAGRETLAINPVDASSRSIADGDVVRVFNPRGACFAGVATLCDRASSACRVALVRSGGRGRGCVMRARQRQRADPRLRDIAAQPGAEFGDGIGTSGALRRGAAGQIL